MSINKLRAWYLLRFRALHHHARDDMPVDAHVIDVVMPLDSHRTFAPDVFCYFLPVSNAKTLNSCEQKYNMNKEASKKDGILKDWAQEEGRKQNKKAKTKPSSMSNSSQADQSFEKTGMVPRLSLSCKLSPLPCSLKSMPADMHSGHM